MSINILWIDLLKEFIIILQKAWNYKNKNMVNVNDTSYEIKLNYNILKLYLEHFIVFF